MSPVTKSVRVTEKQLRSDKGVKSENSKNSKNSKNSNNSKWFDLNIDIKQFYTNFIKNKN